MADYNCVTLNSTGQVFRYGTSDFLNDGSFDGANETYHANVGLKIEGLAFQYTKVVATVLAEMTQGEKDAVDAVLEDVDKDYHTLMYPPGQVETLSADGAASPYSYASKIDTTNLALTLVDGKVEFHAKLIQTQGGSSCTVACTLTSPSVSFTLGANNKAQLMWHTDGGISVWKIVDSKGLTLNI